MNEQGEPTSTNDVYRNLKADNFLLSPYATWNVTENTSFDRLKVFKNINLELGGHGQFVSENISSICNNDLSKYYQKLDQNEGTTSDQHYGTAASRVTREISAGESMRGSNFNSTINYCKIILYRSE